MFAFLTQILLRVLLILIQIYTQHVYLIMSPINIINESSILVGNSQISLKLICNKRTLVERNANCSPSILKCEIVLPRRSGKCSFTLKVSLSTRNKSLHNHWILGVTFALANSSLHIYILISTIFVTMSFLFFFRRHIDSSKT